MKAKEFKSGFQTTVEELFSNGDMINIRVDFYAGSYQYADSKFFTISSVEDFNKTQKLIKSILEQSKNGSTKEAQKETFWATFTPELEKIDSEEWEYAKYDLFNYRVSI